MKPRVYDTTGSQGRPVFRTLPAGALATESEVVFPGMGQRSAQGYDEQLEQFPLNVATAAAQETMPTERTTLTAWARGPRAAFR